LGRAFDVEFLAAEAHHPEDAELFNFAETAEQIWKIITAWYEQSNEVSLPDGRPISKDSRERRPPFSPAAISFSFPQAL